MIKGKSIFAGLVLALLITAPIMAQSPAKVIAIVNKANWCPVCRANDKRAEATFKENNKDNSILFLSNDQTDSETEKKSAVELKKYGLDKIIANYEGTGNAYFFNAETKVLINWISVAESDEKLIETMAKAKKGLK